MDQKNFLISSIFTQNESLEKLISQSSPSRKNQLEYLPHGPIRPGSVTINFSKKNLQYFPQPRPSIKIIFQLTIFSLHLNDPSSMLGFIDFIITIFFMRPKLINSFNAVEEFAKNREEKDFSQLFFYFCFQIGSMY